MSIEDARSRLCLAAVDYGRTQKSSRELEAAASAFPKAQLDAASGTTAAAHQAKKEEKRGTRLCESCATAIIPSHNKDGVVWLNQKNFQIHRCNRGGF